MSTDGGIIIAAQSTAQQVMFDFMLRLLEASITRVEMPAEHSSRLRVLREAVRLHRSEYLVIPPGHGLDDRRTAIANPAFRQEVERLSGQLTAMLDRLDE